MNEMIGNISAKIQPRISAGQKILLEDVVPLEVPFSAHIDVCSVCNFKCSFCFQADTEGMKAANLKRGMMPVELFEKIVDDLAAFKNKLKKVKIGNHGEPTLHPSLPEMIEYVRSKNVAEIVEVFTNGSQLNPELNKQIISAGLQRINLSLEGLTSERYKAVAGVNIDIEDLIDNITHLFKIRGECKIYVKIADQTSALDNDDDTIFQMTDEEKNYFFSTFGNICDEIFVEKIVPQWAQTQYEKQNKIGSEGMYGQEIKKYKNICPFTFMYLHFNWDGSTSPCTLDWPKKVTIGNVKNESVVDIWNGNKLRDLQIAQLEGHRDKINFCNDCSAPMVCCNENLDMYAQGLLKKIVKLRGVSNEKNPWITDVQIG